MKKKRLEACDCNNDKDERDRKEKKRHRLVRTRRRKKRHYNEKKSKTRQESILRYNKFITDVSERKVMEREEDPDDRTSVTFNSLYTDTANDRHLVATTTPSFLKWRLYLLNDNVEESEVNRESSRLVQNNVRRQHRKMPYAKIVKSITANNVNSEHENHNIGKFDIII